MTEGDFINILVQINSDASRQFLSVPIHETPLDSFELIQLRSTLEARTGKAISDDTWFQAETLNDILRGLQ